MEGNAVSKLYIANTTKQHYRLYYTLPAHRKNYILEIPSGSQKEIPHDLVGVELDHVVDQIERLGGRSIREVTEHTPDYFGLAYFIDKPVPEEKILAGHEAVVENAEVRSIEEVSKAAKGFDIINRDGDDVKEKLQGRRKGKTVEVQIQQETPGDGTRPPIDTKFIVTDKSHEDFSVQR